MKTDTQTGENKPLTKEGLLAYFEQFLNGERGMASAEVLVDICLQVQYDTEQRCRPIGARADDWTAIESKDNLPEINKPFSVTIIEPSGERSVERCAHRGGIWFYCDRTGEAVGYLLKTQKVVAYKPLPAPYVESMEEGK